LAAAEHNAGTDDDENHKGDQEVADIFDGGRNRVFGSGGAGFKGGKARLHYGDENGADENP